MFTRRSLVEFSGLAILSAGCASSPMDSSSEQPMAVAAHHPILSAPWSGSNPSSSPRDFIDRMPDVADDRHQGWGRHYKWRGPGPRPAWYGRQPHEPNRLVEVGNYFYPYYLVGDTLYPVYSMPHTRSGGVYRQYFSTYLPKFGPYAIPVRKARTLSHGFGEGHEPMQEPAQGGDGTRLGGNESAGTPLPWLRHGYARGRRSPMINRTYQWFN